MSMTSEKRDFYGKEVADAIKQACKELNVPQEQLEIEVVETGSTGIFGLIRKKAHITAYIKSVEEKEEKPIHQDFQPQGDQTSEMVVEKEPEPTPKAKVEDVETAEPDLSDTDNGSNEANAATLDDDEVNGLEDTDEDEEIPESALEIIQQELSQLLQLMGYASPVEVSSKGSSVFCKVGDEHEKILTGQDGKTLDSIQYLLRKIIARKVPNRIRLTVDVGNYREKRLEELKEKAAELAVQVKASGKTQVIAALSPSERRVIHMSLQDDKEIRSRSVGDGLFKKILIYKPGKGSKGGGRKRNNSRGRRGSNNRKKRE